MATKKKKKNGVVEVVAIESNVAPLPEPPKKPMSKLTCSVEKRALEKLDDMCAQVEISRGDMLTSMILQNRSSAFERLKDLEGANMRLAAQNKILQEALNAAHSKYQYDLARLKQSMKKQEN